jgi:hypothetical protein
MGIHAQREQVGDPPESRRALPQQHHHQLVQHGAGPGLPGLRHGRYLGPESRSAHSVHERVVRGGTGAGCAVSCRGRCRHLACGWSRSTANPDHCGRLVRLSGWIGVRRPQGERLDRPAEIIPTGNSSSVDVFHEAACLMMIPGRDPPVDGPGVSPRGAKTVVFRGGFGVQRKSPRIKGLHRQDRFIEGPKIHKTSLISEDLGVLYLQTPMTYDVVEAAVALRLARSEGIETRWAGRLARLSGPGCRATPCPLRGH